MKLARAICSGVRSGSPRFASMNDSTASRISARDRSVLGSLADDGAAYRLRIRSTTLSTISGCVGSLDRAVLERDGKIGQELRCGLRQACLARDGHRGEVVDLGRMAAQQGSRHAHDDRLEWMVCALDRRMGRLLADHVSRARNAASALLGRVELAVEDDREVDALGVAGGDGARRPDHRVRGGRNPVDVERPELVRPHPGPERSALLAPDLQRDVRRARRLHPEVQPLAGRNHCRVDQNGHAKRD